MAAMGYVHEDQPCVVCNGSQDLSLRKKQAACRYYQAGNCRRGPGCPFAHGSTTAQLEPPSLSHPAYQAEHMFAYHPPGQTPVYRPLGPQTHPVFLWQPYLPSSPPFDPRYGPARQTEIVSDFPDDKSDPSSTESPSTGTSMDHQLRVAFDAAWSEGADFGAARGLASPSSDLGTNSSLGYGGYSYPIFPAVKAEYVTGRARATSGPCPGQGTMVTIPSPFSLSWQDDMKKKPLAYKTKPCKFYTANGKCSSGEKCTFIHDPESRERVEEEHTELTPPPDANLPPKPLNKYDDSRARDFYPITWRVIGGGVMMGGKRQLCRAYAAGYCKYGNDCKLAHETELKTDQVGFIELGNETVYKVEGSLKQLAKSSAPKRSQGRKPSNVLLPERQPLENFPSTTPHLPRSNTRTPEGTGSTGMKSGQVATSSARDAPTSPVHRRTQSMSMVVTSAPPLDTTHPNYAAEL